MLSSIEPQNYYHFESSFYDKKFREKLYLVLLAEYGRVIVRELNKSELTLSTVLKERITYREFLHLQLEFVKSKIGDFSTGISFFEKIYRENFREEGFENITAKNIILHYRARIENILKEGNSEKDETLTDSVNNVFRRMVLSPDDVAIFNLQEEHTRREMIASVARVCHEAEFIHKAKIIIERQSLVVINMMNSLFIEKLKHSLLEEQKLKSEIMIRQKQVQDELNRAKKIQQNLLPKYFPLNSGLKFYTKYIPMASVGGDFYDIVKFKQFKEQEIYQKIGMLVADVSGHGVPAAFIASMAKISWTNTIARYHRSSDILKRLNFQLMENIAGNYVTAIVCIFKTNLETDEKFLEMSNAGHYLPYILKADGSTLQPELKGKILGVFPNIDYNLLLIPYATGDRFIFFTDGLVEARKESNKELLGENRLFKIFEDTRKMEGSEACDYILREIEAFSNKILYEDDITLIIVDAA